MTVITEKPYENTLPDYTRISDKATFDYQTYVQNLTYPLLITDDSLTISWFTVPGATSYELVVKEEHQDTLIYQTTVTLQENLTITNLEAGQNYKVYMNVYNNNSFLVRSNEQVYTIAPYQPDY